MKRFRIKHINAHNFKGFPTLNVELTGSSVILGGLNGYGKTTIFDALELLFTGKIERFVQYDSNFINHNCARSQEQIPLVFDMTEPVISVGASIMIDGELVQLKREAKVVDLENPLKFEPFSQLQIFDTENKCFTAITDQQREILGINELERDYCVLNYLSQEEATSFLKCKDKDRSDMVQGLLDTTLFDLPMDKIKLINKEIDKLINIRKEKKQLDADIKQLRQTASSSANTTNYVSLSNNDAVWDAENPQLTDEDYESWIKENGIIDNLMYYINHKTDFEQYNRNNAIADLMGEGVLNDVVFYLQNKEKESLITSYNQLRRTLIEPINNLLSNSISTLNIDTQTIPTEAVSIETIQQMRGMINQYINMMQSSDNIQRMVGDLLETRNLLATKLQASSSTLDQTKCPLCGTEFSSADKLSATIKQYETDLNENFASLNKGLGEQFSQLKSALLEKIVEPLQKFFISQGVSEQIANRFKELDLQSIIRRLRNLDKLSITYDISKTESDCVAEIVAIISPMIVAVDNNIDFRLLNQMFNSYVNKDIDKESFTIENLEKKRAYLISQWNQTRSTLLSKKEQEKQLVSNCIIKLNERKESLKGLSNHIKQQKNQYVTKIISDIQILFYIYSGRILQDNYFGRGLFIKPDLDRKRILFVSGNYQNNDVDALYHMSSGQLVAVAISFMLSLNRLYSTNNIIAIDDPIQTIDDINFWGLMETLRHEFKDHFLLLSTHETNYEQLLNYKFRKIGIQSELINTADLHNNQNSVDSY